MKIRFLIVLLCLEGTLIAAEFETKDTFTCPSVESVNRAIRENIDSIGRVHNGLASEWGINIEGGFNITRMIRVNLFDLGKLNTVKGLHSIKVVEQMFDPEIMDIMCIYSDKPDEESIFMNFVTVEMPMNTPGYDVTFEGIASEAQGELIQFSKGGLIYSKGKLGNLRPEDLIFKIVKKDSPGACW